MFEVGGKVRLPSATLGNPSTGAEAALPDPTLLRALSILSFSLFTSIFTAFFVISGQGWLRHYAETGTHGSIADRARDRQRKMNAIVTWRFDLIMKCLSLAPRVGLLTLCYGLYCCFSFVNPAVLGGIGFTAIIFVGTIRSMAHLPDT